MINRMDRIENSTRSEEEHEGGEVESLVKGTEGQRHRGTK